MWDKLKYDSSYGFWYQPFWEPVMAGFSIAGMGVCLIALISGVVK